MPFVSSGNCAQVGWSRSFTKSDQLFLELMIARHEGALDMVTMISESKYPEVSSLAETIVEVQTPEIEVMKALLRPTRIMG